MLISEVSSSSNLMFSLIFEELYAPKKSSATVIEDIKICSAATFSIFSVSLDKHYLTNTR
jgi:hypothetical protein